MTSPADEASPRLRVVRGEPTPEELAVIIALASVAGGSGEEPATAPTRGRWNDPAALFRRPGLQGPGGWRAAAR